jgi:hypothetical protein
VGSSNDCFQKGVIVCVVVRSAIHEKGTSASARKPDILRVFFGRIPSILGINVVAESVGSSHRNRSACRLLLENAV